MYQNVDTYNQSDAKTRNTLWMLQLTYQSSSVTERFVKTCSHSRVAPFSPFYSHSLSFIPDLLPASRIPLALSGRVRTAARRFSQRGSNDRAAERKRVTVTEQKPPEPRQPSAVRSEIRVYKATVLSWLRVHAWTAEGRERIDEYNAVSLSSHAIQARRLSNRGRFETTRIRNFVIHKRNCKTAEKSERSFVTMHRAKRAIHWVLWTCIAVLHLHRYRCHRVFNFCDIYRNLRVNERILDLFDIFYDSHS